MHRAGRLLIRFKSCPGKMPDIIDQTKTKKSASFVREWLLSAALTVYLNVDYAASGTHSPLSLPHSPFLHPPLPQLLKLLFVAMRHHLAWTVFLLVP